MIKARDDGWQWHQLDHLQIICTSPLTDNHAFTSHSVLYVGLAAGSWLEDCTRFVTEQDFDWLETGRHNVTMN